jgi:hypothetical protein
MCPIVRVALSSSIRLPLYTAIDENNFRRKFHKDYVDNFLSSLLDEIRIDYNEYIAIYDVSCEILTQLPNFDEITSTLYQIIKDFWISKIIEQMILTCEKKIATYTDYMPLFQDTGDTYMIQVVQACIDKNKRYIDELKEHM